MLGAALQMPLYAQPRTTAIQLLHLCGHTLPMSSNPGQAAHRGLGGPQSPKHGAALLMVTAVMCASAATVPTLGQCPQPALLGGMEQDYCHSNVMSLQQCTSEGSSIS
jgi:hypothetical protein